MARISGRIGKGIDVPGARLVCPMCKGDLAKGANTLACTSCGRLFRQPGDGYINLLPDRLLDESQFGWQERQREMEAWYRDLIADPEEARGVLMHDHEPYAAFLASLSGTVLDLGGGAGVVRIFLDPEVDHVVVDPSLDWLEHGWADLITRLASGSDNDPGHRSTFIRAAAEYLPFAEQSFDAVVAFWSLNHVFEPAAAFLEAHRVLRPQGQFLLVLEDMEPSWSDLLKRLRTRYGPTRPPSRHPSSWTGKKVLKDKIRRRWLGQEWPLQPDHLRIRDSDVRRWSRGRFVIKLREWRGDFLAYRLEVRAA